MNEQASVNVPKDILEPILRQHIAAGVIAAIGDPVELIRSVVERAIKTKVDRDGRVSDQSYCNRNDLIETVSKNAIVDATRNAIEKYVAEQQPEIEAAVEKELKRHTGQFAKALVTGLVQSTKQIWKVECNFVPVK